MLSENMIIISFETEYNNVTVKNSNSYMHDLVMVFINHTKFRLRHDYSKIQFSIFYYGWPENKVKVIKSCMNR